MESVFYKAGPATTAKVKQFFADDRVTQKAADAFAAEFEAAHCMHNGYRIIGIQMPYGAKTPHGFRKNRQGTCVPNKRTQAGRDLAKQIDALPRVPDLSDYVLGDRPSRLVEFADGGLRFVQCGAHSFEDAVHIEMREGDKPPEDCVPIKRSEHYRRVEAAEAAEAVTAEASP
jgi:hypothetical protein